MRYPKAARGSRCEGLGTARREKLGGTFEQDDMDNWQECTRTCTGKRDGWTRDASMRGWTC